MRASCGLGFEITVYVADPGLERKGTVVKGSTHWECRDRTLIYQGADRDQLRSPMKYVRRLFMRE
jgi:hypothetical protein